MRCKPKTSNDNLVNQALGELSVVARCQRISVEVRAVGAAITIPSLKLGNFRVNVNIWDVLWDVVNMHICGVGVEICTKISKQPRAFPIEEFTVKVANS